MVGTQEGKAKALASLEKRRAANVKRHQVRNEDLPADSPMYFACLSCGADIVLPESYIPPRPKMCAECQALYDLGWLTT